MSSTTISADLTVPERALAIGAHPDDIEFGAGATLAKWADAGCEVHLLVLTDGSKGSWDESADRAELVEVRAREQHDAAHTLGAHAVHFAHQIDGELESTIAARARVCEVIRQTRPDVILGHDPWKRYRIHPDHRHAGFLTIDGIVAARDHLFFAEQGLAPHRPDVALLFEADVVDHVEIVTDGNVERKLQALLDHRSQWRSTMGIADDVESQRRAFADAERADHARAGALVDAALGEAFKRLDDL